MYLEQRFTYNIYIYMKERQLTQENFLGIHPFDMKGVRIKRR